MAVLYLLKSMFPKLWLLSKTFQAGKRSFSRIYSVIDLTKFKIKEIVAKIKLHTGLKKNLNDRHVLIEKNLITKYEKYVDLITTRFGESIVKNTGQLLSKS